MTFNLRTITRSPAWDSGTFERRVNRLFNDAFGATATWLPAVDISEEQNATRIAVELPGVRPDDVKVTLEDGVLTIHGTKEVGTFERSFTLPDTVDASGITANYEHGVVTVTLPKAEKAKPKVIEVQVSSK